MYAAARENQKLAVLAWRASSRSNDNGAQCVEAGSLLNSSDLVAVRDSTDREGPALLNSASDWNALLSTLRVSQVPARLF